MHSPIRGSLLACAAALSVGCGGGQKGSASGEPGARTRNGTALAQLDATTFPDDPTTVTRIIHMPFADAAARLGSLSFDAKTQFVFSRDTDDAEQANTAKVAQDAEGNFHVAIDTGTNQVELYQIGEQVFVRQDKGHLRRKARRDVATEAWCDLAWSGLAEMLDLFAPRLRFVDGRAENVAGRQARRYELTLASAEEAPATGAAPASSLLPVPPPTRWREQARPLDISGSVWIDSVSGVVLRSKVEGRLEISDRSIRPTQLAVRFEGSVAKVGGVPTLSAPANLPEYERAIPEADPLSFFRSELDKLAAENAARAEEPAKPSPTKHH
jgi:hypothetical protein